jgi:hypothetical protein
MKDKNDTLAWQISIGWVTMLALLAIMVVLSILESIYMKNDFGNLWADPGPKGIKSMVFVVAVYALMPVYVSITEPRGSRGYAYLAVAFAFIALFFFVMHHIAHWYYGQRNDLSSHVLDVTHHIVAIWVIINSLKWARRPLRLSSADASVGHAAVAHG